MTFQAQTSLTPSHSPLFEKFERRQSIEDLLKSANLDRNTLLQIIKENNFNMQDLDETTIQSIIQQSQARTKTVSSHVNGKLKIEFENSNLNSNTNNFERKDENYNDTLESPLSTCTTNKKYGIYSIIQSDVKQLKQNIEDLKMRIQIKCCLNDIISKVEHNYRLSHLQSLNKERKTMDEKMRQMEHTFKPKTVKINTEVDQVNREIARQKQIQNDLLLKKIALKQNVTNAQLTLQQLLQTKRKFSQMKDISQMKPVTVFIVLKYLTVNDFRCATLCCRAWNCALNKPSYWRFIQKHCLRLKYAARKEQRKQNQRTQVKRINHAVMQLKIEPKRHASPAPKPDDIYQQCMQQLQRVLAQAEQDTEEWKEKVSAQEKILLFMQEGMYSKMHELSLLRVNKWSLVNSIKDLEVNKKELHKQIRMKEKGQEQSNVVAQQALQQQKENQIIRKKKLKLQSDLQSIEHGTSSVAVHNELKKLKSQNKRLIKVLLQLREEIPKREQEVKKYKQRVQVLQHQYSQMTQHEQPLP